MHVRVITQKTKKGKVRKYLQIVTSVRRPDGMPAKKVVAHLGQYDPILADNLKVAFKSAKKGAITRTETKTTDKKLVSLSCEKNLLYLPLAVVVSILRKFGVTQIIDSLTTKKSRTVSLGCVTEALVANRCVAPSSKLAFQQWLPKTALAEILGVSNQSLNNTRVHRAMDELADIDHLLQERITRQIIDRGVPRIIYLDLTDIWFESGGGSLSRRGQTKQGHRSKRKIHIALLVNEFGEPMRWKLLPGALNETTVLPEWADYLSAHEKLKTSILIFDRGMPSVSNLNKLVSAENGHLFLTCVKSDAIPTYVTIDKKALDKLQCLPDDVAADTMQIACDRLELKHFKEKTYARDLKLIHPPKPNTTGKIRPPRMRMYLYFNREIQLTKRMNRRNKIREVYDYVGTFNKCLKNAKQSRKEEVTKRQVLRVVEKLSLTELLEVTLNPYPIEGKSKIINSYQVTLRIRRKNYRMMRRYDGVSLIIGHPELDLSAEESITAYRQKDVLETDFRTIKSVLNIRPVFHWTDRKIQSHVTICMLGLLAEKLLETKLKTAELKTKDIPKTAAALVESLSVIYLNRLRLDNDVYTIRTEADESVTNIMKALNMEDLLDAYGTNISIFNSAV